MVVPSGFAQVDVPLDYGFRPFFGADPEEYKVGASADTTWVDAWAAVKPHVHMTHIAQGAAVLQFWARQIAMGGMLQEPYYLL